ncbi:PREDICTED: CAAX prenyl protease 2 [Ceratosolen solmsi marchali]|uniref:CAAX prenyl protease 2 n=1 Tax=Ceratosolen solmsi marchali TaxID=326594 RepID=A0AAJ6YDU3_9HYME|nr:PREDICTED: CAAX prenyl protease 2 [Ceratosolen solmsi marchali]
MELTELIESSIDFPCLSGILGCLMLSVIYVGSLYVWRSPLDRDHPSVIKRRFFSVFVMTLFSPLSLYFGINEKFYEGATLWELLGIRWPGIIQAIIIPLCLTMVLFLGPLYMQGLNGLWRLYVEPTYWLGSAKTLVWWRNQIIAPLSEEWTFRACMLPLLLQCFAPSTAIFICPLFFGVAHFHHLVENTRRGMDFKTALLKSCFQFAYTTVFGAYAAFLFAKTGHFAAPFTAHSFCNHMGFPDLSEVVAYEDSLERAKLLLLFVIGLAAWCFLLTPMTNPSWFNNTLFWQKHITA